MDKPITLAQLVKSGVLDQEAHAMAENIKGFNRAMHEAFKKAKEHTIQEGTTVSLDGGETWHVYKPTNEGPCNG